MSKKIRINDGDYKLSIRDTNGSIYFTTLEASSTSNSHIGLSSRNVVINGVSDSVIVSTTSHTVNLFDTFANTINAFSEATAIQVGATTGTITIRNASTIVSGDLAVNGGDLTSSSVTFNLLNQPTTVNAFNAGTAIILGATTGTITIRNASTVVSGDLAVNGGDLTSSSATFNLLNQSATVTAFNAASSIQIGATSGNLRIRNSTTTLDGDIAVNGGDLTSTSATFNLANQSTTVTAFDSATSIQMGAPTGTMTIRNASAVLDGNVTINGTLTVNGSTTTLNSTELSVDDKNIVLAATATPSDATSDGGGITLKGTTDKTLTWTSIGTNWTSSENFDISNGKTYKINNINVLTSTKVLPNAVSATVGEVATTLSVGATTGTFTINNSNTVVKDLAVNGGDITTSSTTFNLATTGATTINEYGAATTINVGSNNGGTYNLLTTNVNLNTVNANSLDVVGNIETDTIHVLSEITATTNAAAQSRINLGITTGNTGSLILPVGYAADRDVTPSAGYIRYNIDFGKVEFYDGSVWNYIGSDAGNAFITSTTGSFVTPTGTMAQRDASPYTGYLRFNSDLTMLEVYDGTVWAAVGTTVVTSPTGSLKTPAGSTAQRDAMPVAGYFRFNSEVGVYEGYDGFQWQTLQVVLNVIDGGTYGTPEIPPSVAVDGGAF